MKRRVLVSIIVLVFVVAVGLIGYNLTRDTNEVTKINDLINLNLVDSIVLVNGSNGDMTKVLDEEAVKSVINSLDKLQIEEISVEDSAGWEYALLIKSSSSETRITFLEEDTCRINGCTYSIKNMDSYLVDFFHSKGK